MPENGVGKCTGTHSQNGGAKCTSPQSHVPSTGFLTVTARFLRRRFGVLHQRMLFPQPDCPKGLTVPATRLPAVLDPRPLAIAVHRTVNGKALLLARSTEKVDIEAAWTVRMWLLATVETARTGLSTLNAAKLLLRQVLHEHASDGEHSQAQGTPTHRACTPSQHS